MGKYVALEDDIFAVFAKPAWLSESIKTYPSNYITLDTPQEFIRFDIVAARTSVNKLSVGGLLIVDIFTSAGDGPKASATIADILDKHLANKTLSNTAGTSTQLQASTLVNRGVDKDDPRYFMSVYTIPFNYFGA